MRKQTNKKTPVGSRGIISIMLVALLAVFVILFLAGSSFVGLEEKNIADKTLADSQAKYAALGCLQEALVNLRYDENYAGNESYNFGGADCQILAVQNLGGESRLVRSQSSLDNSVQKVEVKISSLKPAIVIDYWDEEAKF